MPAFDVLAADEEGRTLPIQVKASNSEQWRSSADLWLELSVSKGKQRSRGFKAITHPQLIYVFISLKSNSSSNDRFFILDKTVLQKILAESYITYMEERAWVRPRNPKSFDCRLSISQIEAFEDNWKLIANRLRQVPDPAE
ncbi:hypothetical protein E7T09_14700 [Deinococcus sp. KSM4-11]|uniref:hypothetical protein n=1 Tax=Deinococcus sp. KSM4-11 TaxID=2568654 RepID=UPI0010A3347F|nr:hypothetical protein [Deinococcus sp. KSM4-11]THF85781.1 hypothetical protein E7T09_14700 [Deinococcus sp. KSM4-11]